MDRCARLALSPNRVILIARFRDARLKAHMHRSGFVRRTWTAVLSVACTSVAGSALAAPVYLQCQLGEDNRPTSEAAPYRWELSLDEARGSVGWVLPQSSGREDAAFNAREVRWTRTFDGIRNVYAVNRSTLTFSRTVLTDGETLVATGRCRMVAAPRRAF